MTRKVWWQRAVFWVPVLLVAVAVLIWATDFLRWQMVRGLFWGGPSAIAPDRQTVVIIDPMHCLLYTSGRPIEYNFGDRPCSGRYPGGIDQFCP